MTQNNPYNLNQSLHRQTMIHEQRPVEYPVLSAYHPPMTNPRVIIIEEAEVIPNYLDCLICNQRTDTYQVYSDGLFVWVMCMFLFLFTFCLFWVPFCIEDWKDIEYRCVRCHHVKLVRRGGC